MSRLGLGAAVLLAAYAGGALAQDDCIENAAGKTVCGSDADAVRARIRAEARYEENPDRPLKRHSGSVYDGFGPALFVRGGYAFAGLNPGPNVSADAPLFSIGYRTPVARSGQNLISFETEVLHTRASETFLDPFVGPGEARLWALAGLFGLRWQYVAQGVSPFASVAIGPGYVKGKLDFDDPLLVSVTDDEFALFYTGRAGLAVPIGDRVGVEWAYRYLGATRESTFGAHAAEMGLSLSF